MDKNPWTILSEQKIYDNPWISLTEYNVLNPSGGKGIYGKVHFKNQAVAVIALDEEEHTWLVGQYRFALDAYSWEIPEGGALFTEDPLEGAKRELLEETGLKASHWEKILVMHLSNSVSDEIAYVYLAKNISIHTSKPEETEDITVKRLPFEEAFNMVMKGEITDSLTVAAILKTKLLLTK